MSNQSQSEDIQAWVDFAGAVESRLRKGEVILVAAGLACGPQDVPDAIEQYVLDACGLAFALWCRLRALRDAMPPQGGA